MKEQQTATRAREAGPEDCEGKRNKNVALDETALTACDRVFGVTELAHTILHEACEVAWCAAVDLDDADISTWQNIKSINIVAVHIVLSRCYRVSRTWMYNVTTFEKDSHWTTWPVDGKMDAPWPGQIAGQPDVWLEVHDVLFWLDLTYDRGHSQTDHSDCDWGRAQSLQWPIANGGGQFRLPVHATLFEPIRRLPTHLMLITTPPVTIIDIEIFSKCYTSPCTYGSNSESFDADGECLSRGSRLATHHKEAGFTIADLIDLTDAEFRRRDCLTWIEFKSMDHRKEEKLAMTKAQDADL